MEESINCDRIKKLRNEIKNKFQVVDDNCKKMEKIKKIDHIMIIDDDEISNFVTQKTLKCYDLVNKTTVFDNPKNALEYLKKTDNLPNIILLDIKMPVMDGFEFIKEFNLLNLKSEIYILSSSALSNDKDKAKELHIKYMSKPLKINTFQNNL